MHWQQAITRKGESTMTQEMIRESDEIILKATQDCGPILDEIQRDKSMGQRKGTHGAVYCRVPEILYYVKWPEEFKRKFGWHPKRPPPSVKRKDAAKLWRDFFMDKVNERDYSKLKLTDKKHTTTERLE